MVAIHQVARFIHEDHPVGIAIEDDPKISLVSMDQVGQVLWLAADVFGTGQFVDV